jgi:hypothetical protein
MPLKNAHSMCLIPSLNDYMALYGIILLIDELSITQEERVGWLVLLVMLVMIRMTSHTEIGNR